MFPPMLSFRSTMKQLFSECGIQSNTMGSPCPISSSMM